MTRVTFAACSILAIASALGLSRIAADEKPLSRPLMIGHRGACGYRPEHTLAAYELAIDQGADFAEPDLVITKDGVLICRHDVEIGGSTDVAQKYPDRKRKAVIDGKSVEGWFAHDFTLAEIRTLKAREPLAFRNHGFDDRYGLVTFDEYLDLVERKRQELGRTIGIIPEIKNSTYHASQGLHLEDRLVAALRERGYPAQDKPCIIQSFEISNLKYLAAKINVQLLQLIGAPHLLPADVLAVGGKLTYAEMMAPAGLADIAKYAWGVGPSKENILPRDKSNRLTQANTWIQDAHRAQLAVVAYTFRSEPQYLAEDYHGELHTELLHWFEMHLDGAFTDNVDVGVRARAKFLAR